MQKTITWDPRKTCAERHFPLMEAVIVAVSENL
jgi:hypothetical protein